MDSSLLDLLPSLARSMAEKDPARAAAWCASLPEGAARQSALNSVVTTWAGQDPAAAARFALEQPGSDSLLGSWTASSSADAIAWGERLPAGQDRSRAAEAISQSLLWRSPEKAAAWVVQVDDQNRRQRLIRTVAGFWAQSNKTAADQWLNQLGLPDEQRQKMLKPIGRNDYLDYMVDDME